MSDRKDWEDGDMLFAWLEAAGHSPKGKKVHCPWHDDSNPSASILCDGSGHWRVFCHACNRSGDIYDLRNEKPTMDKPDGNKVARTHSKPQPRAPWRDVLASKAEVVARCKGAGVVEAWYKYGDDPAKPTLVIARVKPSNKSKFFWSFTPQEDGSYVSGKDGKSNHPVYLSHKLAAHPTILVCEGEKATDAAWSCGIPATTSNGGASAAKKTDWSALKGKTVVLWPDKDDAGAKYMDEVTDILSDLGCSISRIDVSKLELPKGGDIADMAETWVDKTREQRGDIVTSLMEDAEPVGAIAAFRLERKEMRDGVRSPLECPLKYLGNLSRAFLPGTITICCADPGAGKSLLCVQLMKFWYSIDAVSHARMFEDTASYHMSRILSQLTGQEGHSRPEWVEANAQKSIEDEATHETALAAIGDRIVGEDKEKEGKPWTAEMVCVWAEERAAKKSRVIIIDPLTCISAGEKSWQQDFDVVMSLKATARRHKCSILLTTHPRTGAKAPAMSAMAGGSAWPRFAHTVLWLEGLGAGNAVNTDRGPAVANRTMRILKSRNGKGAGLSIAMNMGDDLQLHELGLIIPDAPKCAIAKEAVAMEKTRRATKYADKPQQNEDLFG